MSDRPFRVQLAALLHSEAIRLTGEVPTGAVVKIEFADGTPIKLKLSREVLAQIRAAGDDEPSDLEANILQALEEMDAGEKMTGEELADKAGYSFNGSFRAMLAQLVRENKIKNLRPGYALEST